MEIKTVTIETKEGPVRINESDYDPDKHKLSQKEPEKKPTRKTKAR